MWTYYIQTVQMNAQELVAQHNDEILLFLEREYFTTEILNEKTSSFVNDI